MKSFSLLATCLAFTLLVGGCVDYMPNLGLETTPQAPRKAPAYKPYYETTQKGQLPPPQQPPIPSQQQDQSQFPPQIQQPAQTEPVTTEAIPAPQHKMKAAILLPLSGKDSALGQAMLNAAQQAVFDAAGPNFELLPRDTASDGGAEEAARSAVAAGAQLIIGPLFASNVPSVRLIAQINDLMMLPLSTDTSLADRGVYVMGMAPGPQVERVISYASKHGIHNFAALIPMSPYGSLVGETFRRTVLQNGDQLVAIEFYDPSLRDIDAKIKALTEKTVPIEGLFLPEGERSLKTIADRLAKAGVDPMRTRFLGTGLWDTAGLGHDKPFLLGGWYAAPDPALRRGFVFGYRAAYNQEPPRLATLAYDATALAAVVAKHKNNYDETVLTNPNGFSGLDGIFRLTLMGHVERAMAILEVTPDKARVIDRSPSSFMHTAQ